jgi:hypothetical protein
MHQARRRMPLSMQFTRDGLNKVKRVEDEIFTDRHAELIEKTPAQSGP